MGKVTENALVLRIKRALAKEDKVLKKCRADSRWYSDFGDYYVVNAFNALEDTHVDLEAFAKELGVLRHGESLGG